MLRSFHLVFEVADVFHYDVMGFSVNLVGKRCGQSSTKVLGAHVFFFCFSFLATSFLGLNQYSVSSDHQGFSSVPIVEDHLSNPLLGGTTAVSIVTCLNHTALRIAITLLSLVGKLKLVNALRSRP